MSAVDALRISAIRGSGHVCPGKLNHPPLPSGVRYPEKVERRPDRILDVRYLEKVERRPDIIPDVRYPSEMSENFRPGGMRMVVYTQG